ncbi:NAD(P)-dependent oxidoreductase [Pseudonocardia ailaonensis]|uniref:NAD(P)-dependent oxidoreductase n=1 Tax=Pseudonocardia ailaonensis TaxID=367279 RepID=A0ABN2MQY7_9PSEU
MSEWELPARPVIGILHPGAMGAALGSALKPRAGAVIWADAGRTHATAKRAELADLIAVPTVADLARRADVVVSICPPHAALEVAEHVAAASRPAGSAAGGPLYVDANAVSPATVARIGELFGEALVDGAVIGPPAWEQGRTVLWLSGPHAATVAGLFEGTPFIPRIAGPEPGTASALKACFALQSKALPAIWLALDEAARAYGVTEQLREELTRAGVDLDDRLAGIGPQAREKGWRWVGEMEEAAAAFDAIGVPGGFSRAAAEVYRRA